MAPLSQSPFLQALGYSIISSLWHFALLWLIYVLINTVFRLSSWQKFSTGYLLQSGGFIWFIVTFILCFRQYSWSEKIYFPLHKSYILYTDGYALTVREKFFAWIMQAENILSYLSVVYLVLLVFTAVKWMKAYHFTKSVRSAGLYETEINWQLFVKQLSARLGIKQEVKIYLSEMVKTPLTIGFFKPLILIPLASLNHLHTDQMEAVILHELAHIKRFDYLFNLFLALIETTLFFNPFTVLISGHIKRERENCCDDWVLQYNYNAASYAGALLQIATCQSSSYLLTLKAADNKQALLNRIKRMIEKKEKTFFNYRYQLLALFVMITVLSSLALLSSPRSSNKVAVSSSKYNTVSNQIAAKSSNLIIVPALPLTHLPKKTILYKAQRPDKSLKRNILLSSLLSEITNKDTNAQISPQQTNSEFVPVKANEVLFANNFDFDDFAEKNIEESNIRLNEVLPANVQLKERQIALAEEKFKKVAINLFKENNVYFNQKQVYEQMKTAFEQIKAAQIQLHSAQRAMSATLQNKNNVLENETAQILQFSQANAEKMKLVTDKLHLEVRKAKRQSDQSPDLDSVFLNYQWQLPESIFNFPVLNKPHSFSFEFSEKPGVKVVLTQELKSRKKAGKINNAFVEDAEEKANSKTKNILLSTPKRSLMKTIRGGKNFYVISI